MREAQGFGDLGLGQGRGADQLVGRADMAVLGEDARGGLGHVAQIDEADPRGDRVGHAIDAVLDDRAPARQDVLHVGGRLEDRHREAGREQQLLDPELRPVVRHRLDLRVQHGVIDEARNAGRLRRGDHGPGVGYLVRAHVRADVIDRAGPVRRCGERGGIFEGADRNLVGALRGDRGRPVGDDGPERAPRRRARPRPR